MQKPDNLYLALGLTRAASDMDIAQAYRAGVQKLQALSGTDPTQVAQRLQQMELAYETLLNPERKKKHDEAIAWFDTQQRLANERALERSLRLKEEEQAAKDAELRAQVLAKDLAQEAARKALADAKQQEEEMRIRAEAAARFHQLRQERADFGETLPQELAVDSSAAPADDPPALPPTSRKAIGKATIAASVAVVAVLFGVLLNLQPGSPSKAPAPAPTAQAPAPVAATQARPDIAAAPQAATAASSPASAPAATTTPPAPAATAVAPSKPRKDDKAASAETQQYQKALRDVEAAHPELNPRHAAYRADLMAFVTTRMQVHTKAGYPKPKALAIAVRDLETQEATHHAIEKLKSQKDKPAPEVAPVPDKGGHSGFDPKCRWVTAQEWSCK